MLPVSVKKLIELHLQQHSLTKRSIATAIGMSDAAFASRMNAEDISMEFVYLVSKATKHDFFSDISIAVRKELKELTVTQEKDVVLYGKVSPAEHVALLKENVELHRKLERCREELEKLKK